MQTIYWAEYLGEKDGKVYLLRKKVPLFGKKLKEEILFTEIEGLDTAFLKQLRDEGKKLKQKEVEGH